MSEWYTGSPVVLTLTVDPYAPDTVAAVTMLRTPAGPIAPIPDAMPDADRHVWQAVVETVPSPGDLDAVWTVTGTGAGVTAQTVAVAPLPGDEPAGLRVYATTADLARYLFAAPPSGSRRRLIRASALLEGATRTAVYDVDAGGLPTDPTVAAAFRDAVCAQAQWWATTGDEQGDAGLWQSVSIGRTSMSRAANTGGPGQRSPRARLCPDAEIILDGAGLLGQAPSDPPYCPWGS